MAPALSTEIESAIEKLEGIFAWNLLRRARGASIRRNSCERATSVVDKHQMDPKRILLVALFPIALLASTVLAQEKESSASPSSKKEAAATAASTKTEIESLRAEIKAQESKIDKLAQEIAELSETVKKERPAASVAATPAPSPSATEPPSTAGVEKPAPADASGTKTHVVARGETLSQISKQYGVPVDQIQQFNKIGDAKKLQAGQTIKIPGNQSASPSAAPGASPAAEKPAD
jgi:LysM repeat protein